MGNRDLIDLYNDEIGGARDILQSIDGGERRYVPAKAIAIIATMTSLIAAYIYIIA